MTSQTLSQQEAFSLAFDRMGSVRTFDEDGRLNVHSTPISKACVNPYRGAEIPNYQKLGLQPNKIYQLLKCPKALAEAAPSFNSLPVLMEHVHVSAKTPHKQLVVGATGSQGVFKKPYLENSLSIWDQKAIDKIHQGEQRELSCAFFVSRR
ncbi:DUF2213 domain-containing protein [Acetobacteraceae bacterium]|nr:DUF2213 domain-containing protein [Acetobacteraceae bacterium]